jgi:hypothetical protein
MKNKPKIFPIKPVMYNNEVPHAGVQFLNYEFGIGNWEFSVESEADFFIAGSGRENIQDATKKYEKYKKPIFHLHITHTGDDQDLAFEEWSEFLSTNSYILSDAYFLKPVTKYIQIAWVENVYNDYRLGYPKPDIINPYEYFYWNSDQELAFQKINHSLDSDIKRKIYISPSKTYPFDPTRSHIRKKLMKLLIDSYSDLGYIGNSDNSDYWLCDNTYDTTNIDDLEKITTTTKCTVSYGQNTPNYLYYQHSYLSVYGETIEGTNTNNCLLMTEKTLNPIMNLHFIFPFSTKHYIKYLIEHKEIRFPKEIDYSYDNVDNMYERWDVYKKELERLLNLSLDDWSHIFNKNIDLLKYNQSVLVRNKIRRNNLLKRIRSNAL